eukprot:1047046-Pleurochrysis_carterae.AAC.1
MSRAVSRASRAQNARPVTPRSIQPTPVDFTSLNLEGWKSTGALSFFKLKDGRVLFTDGRDMARRTSLDGPIDVQLLDRAGGSVTSMPVSELLAISDAAMPGVLVLVRRKGANAQGLRWKGLTATLPPMTDVALARSASCS